MKNWKALLLAGALAGTALLTACSSGGSSSAAASTPVDPDSALTPPEFSDTLRVGASPAPHGEILEQIVDLLADQGVTLEIVIFDDYAIQNTALAEGSLDANYFQHTPYLEDYNENNGTALVPAATVHVEPMGIYAGRSDDLNAFPDGAEVGIPDDPTNEARALLLLESLGLVTLDPNAGLAATPLDVVDNPHNIVFRELAAEQLPASLPDLDFAVINGNYAIAAGVNDAVIETEGADSPYANVVAVRPEDTDSEAIALLIAALQSETVREFILATYGGEVLPVF